MKAVSKQDVIDEVKVLEPDFKCDHDADSLISRLQLLPTFYVSPSIWKKYSKCYSHCH